MTNHLIASTLTALAALGLVLLLRKRGAAIRFAILLVALLRFAVPTPWLDDAGASLARAVAVSPGTPAGRIVEDISVFLGRPVSDADAALAVPAASGVAGDAGKPWFTWRAAAGFVWIASALLCLGLWIHQRRDSLRPVRRPSPGELEALWNASERLGVRNIELRIVGRGSVPGARGWLRPSVVLPEDLEAELTAAELESVVTHELAHVRRRRRLRRGHRQSLPDVDRAVGALRPCNRREHRHGPAEIPTEATTRVHYTSYAAPGDASSTGSSSRTRGGGAADPGGIRIPRGAGQRRRRDARR